MTIFAIFRIFGCWDVTSGNNYVALHGTEPIARGVRVDLEPVLGLDLELRYKEQKLCVTVF